MYWTVYFIARKEALCFFCPNYEKERIFYLFNNNVFCKSVSLLSISQVNGVKLQFKPLSDENEEEKKMKEV